MSRGSISRERDRCVIGRYELRGIPSNIATVAQRDFVI